MNTPKKPYFWSYSIDCDRGRDCGVETIMQSAYTQEGDRQNLAAAISEAITAAIYYVAIGYGSVQVIMQACCDKCSGCGEVPAGPKRSRLLGKRKACPDCKGKGKYADAHLDPIPIVPGDQQKIIEKQQVILVEAPITEEEWGFECDMGDEFFIRKEDGSEKWVVRNWPKKTFVGKISEQQLSAVQSTMKISYFYQ